MLYMRNRSSPDNQYMRRLVLYYTYTDHNFYMLVVVSDHMSLYLNTYHNRCHTYHLHSTRVREFVYMCMLFQVRSNLYHRHRETLLVHPHSYNLLV